MKISYINGRRDETETGITHSVLNPATTEVIETVTWAISQQVSDALEAATDAFQI